ncbi:MAG: hypothetical protein AAFV93_07535 [Chloroflexota bacterium]
MLSLYVFGMLLVRHCGQSQIVAMLCSLYKWNYNTVRQRLRELTYESRAKRGTGRTTLDVQKCFAPLLGWVLSKFQGEHRQVVLALDATYLKDRFIILAVSVVVAGCAIPVAWHIRKANEKGKWNPIWKTLLSHLVPVMPAQWKVFVLTDSGLYSKPLFENIRNKGWYPMMRIEGAQGLFQSTSCSRWHPIRQFAYEGMQARCIQGLCFKGDPLRCTLVVQWTTGCQKPCLLVTSLPPQQIQHNVYAIRY